MATYASPPRSSASPAATKASLDSTFQALSQAPPPTIREILGAYSAKGEGDREMLVALLNAKSAEDARIAAVATLQQTVLQMQHSLALAQAQAAAAQAQSPQQLPSPRDIPSPLMQSAPASRKRTTRAPAPTGRRSPSASPRQSYDAQYTGYARPHPYARPQDAYTERSEREWAPPRRNWASMSSERSTSEEGSERE